LAPLLLRIADGNFACIFCKNTIMLLYIMQCYNIILDEIFREESKTVGI
jgi:hypothetical protein